MSSTTSSAAPTLSAYSMVYSMPAQPPFLTPTRTPAIGRSALAINSLSASGGGLGEAHHLRFRPGVAIASSPRFGSPKPVWMSE